MHLQPRTLVADVVLPAPPATVAGAVRSVAVLGAALGVVVPGRPEHLLCAGDAVHLGATVLRVEHERTTTGSFALRCTHERGPGRGSHLHASGRPTADGTVLTLRLRVPGRALPAWVRAIDAETVRLRGAREVVAGAVLREGRLLLARRAWPPELAGRWELPGGGVEPGERSGAALVRELTEELGVRVAPGEQLGADVPIADRVLRARVATLVAGQPRALEHQELAWVDAPGLLAADLVPADRAWTGELVALLGT